jgi:hypothetical protein
MKRLSRISDLHHAGFMHKPKKPLYITLFLALLFCGYPAQAGDVLLDQGKLQSIGPLGWIAPNLEVPTPDRDVPLVDPNDKSPAASLLRRYQARGLAGGLDGVLYDNRDRGHSTLPGAQFPSLSHLTYGPELRAEGLDYGLAGRVILPAIVIGNSSTALTRRPSQRSQPRFAMTASGGPERAFLTYANNHIYVYPEHHDHDAVDVFPANWPYMVISQGSSHSDMPFVKALVMTTAAFSDETRDFLEAKRLIAPTLQMIFRRSQKGLYTREQYLSASSHPTVFDAARLAPERMVAMASTMRPDEIPPLVRLDVESEDFSTAAGLAGLSELLFSTPSSIARIWRSDAYSRSMTVSAAKTEDPNGRALSFEWVVLRGDPAKVRITPLNAQRSRALISVDWHDAMRIMPNAERMSNRVDIGVFASNGVHDSAPAFVSISFPHHHSRAYGPVGEDAVMRLMSIDYTGEDRLAYFDPLLHWTAGWRDEFTYDLNGDMVGWKRILPGKVLTLLGTGSGAGAPLPAYDLEIVNGRPHLSMITSQTASE